MRKKYETEILNFVVIGPIDIAKKTLKRTQCLIG